MQKKILALALLFLSTLAHSAPKEEMSEQQINEYEEGILSGLLKEITHSDFRATYLDPFEKRPTSKEYEKYAPIFEDFLKNYKEGDKIWMYMFDLSGPGTGRTGLTIVRKDEVVTWLELSIE